MTANRTSGSRHRAERRRSERHPLEVQIEITIGRALLFLATTNLSRDGAFLQRAIPYPVGTKAKVRILLPDEGEPIECPGVVANIPDKKDVGMGLRFTGISERDQRRIDAFARQVAEEIDVEL